MTTTVWVTTKFQGFHRWPDALPQVSYLSHLHAHMFHVRLEVQYPADVQLNNRVVEYHMLYGCLTRVVKALPVVSPSNMSSMSCEMMAKEIANSMLALGFEVTEVQVSEDGECGATLRFPAKS